MSTPDVRSSLTAVILGGAFNPRIFEPTWLAKNELIAADEVEDARVQLIDRDFCHLDLGWLDLVVTQEEFRAETTPSAASDLQLRDLVVGVFRLLPHTPIEGGSIHHRSHIAVPSEEAWHEVGHALAPKELWSGILEEPGLFDFAMLGARPDDLKGAIKVRIRPSGPLSSKTYGILLNVNDEFHFETESDEMEDGGKADISSLIETLWPDAESRALEIRTRLFERLLP